VPLQPESADLAIMNEVISHIHPSYLPVVYSEMARILTPGGILFISDGNNLGNPEYASSHLYPLYEALENGPDGTRVGDVQVQSCFINQRKRIIQVRHPDMSIDEVDYLARNTSGLFGDYLDEVIDCFAIKGDLVRRPYRKGSAPVYPDSGQVEENGFYPEGVVFDLVRTGFDCSPSAGNRIVLEASQMRPSAGYGHNAYEITMPKGYPVRVSPLLLENNRPLPIPTDNHAEIGEKGRGRYSMWRANGTIYFSSSDNSDPRRNRRKYELYWMDWSAGQPVYPSANFQIVAVKTI
jgi:hypothetical protein